VTRRTRWITRLLGPAVLAYFLITTDLHRIAANLRGVRWTPFALSLALFAGLVLTKAWRWRVLLRELGLAAPTLREASTLFMIGQFAGGATPGQSGDFVRAWYLRDRGAPLSTALFSILLDRLLDFLLLSILSLFGLVTFLDIFPAALRPAILVSTIGFAIAVAVAVPALIARGPRRWLMTRLGRIAPASLRQRLERWQSLLDVLEVRPGLMVALLLTTVAATAVVMLRIWLLYRAMDVVIPVALLVSASALISILQTLPVSVAGMGVRDAVLIAVLTHHGYAAERALALSALFLALTVEQMLIGFFVSMRHPLGVDRTALAESAGEGGP
jgi:uncharacterized protein (TIRG00374 family)